MFIGCGAHSSCGVASCSGNGRYFSNLSLLIPLYSSLLALGIVSLVVVLVVVLHLVRRPRSWVRPLEEDAGAIAGGSDMDGRVSGAALHRLQDSLLDPKDKDELQGALSGAVGDASRIRSRAPGSHLADVQQADPSLVVLDEDAEVFGPLPEHRASVSVTPWDQNRAV